MDNRKPSISVIMGIYNCAPTLMDALDSLKNQSFRDFCIILCDDGSTDDTFSVAKAFSNAADNVILIQNERNMGLNYTLNRCLGVAYEVGSKYVARMDGDDISCPDRFKKEYNFLEEHQEYDFVSCPMQHFDNNGVFKVGSVSGEPLLKDFVRSSPFCHAPVLMRAEAYKKVNGYSVSSRLLRVEDYHLWYKLYLNGCKGYRLSEPLYMMRDDREAYGRRTMKSRFNEAYVKYLVVRDFKLPIWNYVYCLKPIFIGILPGFIYNYLHRNR